LTVPYWIMKSITWPSGGRQGFVANEKVKVLSTSLHWQMTAWTSTSSQKRRLVGNTRSARAWSTRSACRTFGRNGSRKDEWWRIISSETYSLCIDTCTWIFKRAFTDLVLNNQYHYKYHSVSLRLRISDLGVTCLSMTTAGVWGAMLS